MVSGKVTRQLRRNLRLVLLPQRRALLSACIFWIDSARAFAVPAMPQVALLGTPQVAQLGTPQVAQLGTQQVALLGTPQVALLGTLQVALLGTPQVALLGTLQVALRGMPQAAQLVVELGRPEGTYLGGGTLVKSSAASVCVRRVPVSGACRRQLTHRSIGSWWRRFLYLVILTRC